MKKVKRDPYYENILEQAVGSGGPLVIYSDDAGNPYEGLFLLNGNRTMCLKLSDVERKKTEMETQDEM